MGQNQTLTNKGFQVRNKFKKALFCAALAASGTVFAGGPLDGAFSCDVTYPGVSSYTGFVAVVTNAQGVTAMAPVAMDSYNPITGYATGLANSNTFTGKSQFNLPFTFSVDPGFQGFYGQMGVLLNTGPITVVMYCKRIW